MAERMLIAFGRYLRMLRERKGLSLEDVALVTKPYADPVSKGYLSRVENGHTKIGFSKMIALSRAYDVPLGVVAERHSLDLELEKMGNGPDTKGKTLAELRALGRKARDRGLRWEAYACFRDALTIAKDSEALPEYSDSRDQLLATTVLVATFANRLGRRRLALHELEWVRSVDGRSDETTVLLLHQLAAVHLGLRDVTKARTFAAACVDLAEKCRSRLLAFAYDTRAIVAMNEGRHDAAIADYQTAIRIHGEKAEVNAVATLQVNIAQLYFQMRRFRAARRSLAVADKLAIEHGIETVRSRVMVVRGEIEAAEGRYDLAATLWREAIDVARRSNDKIVLFTAEFELYRQAVNRGEQSLLKSLARRLTRLAPWIPADVPELQAFRDLAGSQPPDVKRRGRVPARQPQ